MAMLLGMPVGPAQPPELPPKPMPHPPGPNSVRLPAPLFWITKAIPSAGTAEVVLPIWKAKGGENPLGTFSGPWYQAGVPHPPWAEVDRNTLERAEFALLCGPIVGGADQPLL